MNSYNIFMKHSQKEIQDVIFVKIGLNYQATILNILWLFHNKMIVSGTILLIIYFYAFYTNIYAFLFMYVVISVILCFFANKMLVKYLIYIENCKFLGISDGKNINEARKLFLKEFEKEND